MLKIIGNMSFLFQSHQSKNGILPYLSRKFQTIIDKIMWCLQRPQALVLEHHRAAAGARVRSDPQQHKQGRYHTHQI